MSDVKRSLLDDLTFLGVESASVRRGTADFEQVPKEQLAVLLAGLLWPDEAKRRTTRPTTPEEMRTFVLDGINWALTAPLISRFLSQDAQDGLHSQYGYWQDAPVDQLQKLLDGMPKRP